jgi:hypothetical protein
MNAMGSLLSAFMKKIAGLCRHHECGMLNLECAYRFTIPIRDGSGNFERISYNCLRTSKACGKIKGTVEIIFNT